MVRQIIPNGKVIEFCGFIDFESSFFSQYVPKVLEYTYKNRIIEKWSHWDGNTITYIIIWNIIWLCEFYLTLLQIWISNCFRWFFFLYKWIVNTIAIVYREMFEHKEKSMNISKGSLMRLNQKMYRSVGGRAFAKESSISSNEST